ncbi:MAG: type II/IV secretion system protein, partial [Deltaproteobacteria bacterium]|nr:type II/IV secretion system protein [Deltaproteobacteria bacterium]
EEKARYAREMHLPIVSRIKIISGLDIAERRSPQDGRVRIKVGGKPIDLRVSTYPTIHGEKVVLRLLATSEKIGIEELGFSEHERKIFSELIGRPHGIFLVTGPTGSGKSTTLYAALERLNSPEKNIVSIEDPVEREITGVSQAQINTKAGITFASALRAILRQDPDIIMLGEIRDRETAEISVRAAITGHLVLTTLHTNTAAGAISRLNDLGVESFLLSSSLVGVLAQRLVRKICSSCREEVPSSDQGPPHFFKGKIETMFRGKGCPECHLSGYSGRVGIFELVPVRGKILQLIADGAKEDQIEKEIRSAGIRSMLDDGIEKIVKGVTTLDEVLRVVQED